MNISDTIWPDAVNETVNDIIDHISDLIDEKEASKSNLKAELTKKVFDRYINDEEDLRLTDEEFEQAYLHAAVATALDSLAEKGIVSSIEDENGEPVFWLTAEGKELAEKQ